MLAEMHLGHGIQRCLMCGYKFVCSNKSLRNSRHFSFSRQLNRFSVLNLLTGQMERSEQQTKRNVLVAGLGNSTHPGTRHSLGHEFLDRIAKELGLTWYNSRSVIGIAMGYGSINGWTAVAESDTVRIVFVKSKYPMNLNGLTVFKAVQKHSVALEDIFIACDDLETRTGLYKFHVGTSHWGHNGIKSVRKMFQGQQLNVIRIGTGRPRSKNPEVVLNFVLSKPTEEELSAFAPIWAYGPCELFHVIQEKYGHDPTLTKWEEHFKQLLVRR